LWELVALRLGLSVATAAAKFWFRDRQSAATSNLSLSELVRRRVPHVFDQGPTEREFERMAEIVAAKAASFIEGELRGLRPNEAEAAIVAVAETFDAAAFDAELVFANDLDPVPLEAAIRSSAGSVVERAALSGQALALYDVLLAEACTYVVEIINTLPNFDVSATREILRRETELAGLVRQALERLPEASSAAGDADAEFETRYRRQLARRLDELVLFGVDLPAARRRYALSVAYITLAATEKSEEDLSAEEQAQIEKAEASPPATGPTGSEDEDFERISSALSRHSRSLVRGEAGSGKTTLLQWLAVTSCRDEFDGPLASWNGSIPFFIQLRRFVGRDLPAPQDFIDAVLPTLTGLAPEGWTHRQLDEGRALVLVDGVDELPEESREAVRTWLDELVEGFPESRFVVTSRPPAIETGWLSSSGFADHELQPMTLSDIDSFLDHWHDAACVGLGGEPEAIEEMEGFKVALKAVIRANRAIRALATNPLLCAMLCALNRERQTQLPRERMELYRIALEMLLERRDVERRVGVGDLVLTLREKYALLQDIAFWLIINGQSSIDRQAALAHVEAKLRGMHQIDHSAEDVFDHLLLRTGVLREPVEGQVDFIHRTFQEYLAAAEAVEQKHIPMLIQSAHLDQWREVVILAAGHAPTPERNGMLGQLLARGHGDVAHRHRLLLLAVACLETSVELDPILRESVELSLVEVLPPTNMTDAKAVASAGELAIPQLAGFSGGRVHATTVAACVRALALIGGPEALQALKGFARDRRVTVTRELMRAWSLFESEEYASEVLAESPLNNGRLLLRDPGLLPAVKSLRNLTVLSCSFSRRAVDLTHLTGLEALVSLSIESSPTVTTLKPLEGSPNLAFLSLTHCTELTDIQSLRSLPALRTLFLSYDHAIDDLTVLGDLPNIASLRLMRSPLSDLEPILRIPRLDYLDIEGTEVSRLADLAGYDVTSLDAAQLSHVEDFSPLGDLPNLRFLRLTGNRHLVSLEWVSKLAALEALTLNGCGVADLGPLVGLANLHHLSLVGTEVSDLSPLRHLPQLDELDLTATPATDLEPIFGLSGATIRINASIRIEDLPDEFRQANWIRRAHGPSAEVFRALPSGS
jgi:Leucine-rich repeat (LRR) protein